MFQIYNGGTTFKQWSKGNKLVMDVLPVGADVLFYNETYSDSPIKSDVYEITVDDEIIKVCDVPSVLLTKAEKIKVCVGSVVTGKYGVNHSMVGPREKYFEVEPADKPAGYVEDPVPAGNGASSWNQLTDKPFHKEVTVTKKPVDLSLREGWHYDIPEEDFISVGVRGEYAHVAKVSDGILSNDDIRKLSFTGTIDGELIVFDCANLGEYDILLEDDYAVFDVFGRTIIVVRKPGANVRISTMYQEYRYFGKPGFYVDTNIPCPSSIKTVEPVFTFTTETIKTIDPEFMPEGYPYKKYVEVFEPIELNWGRNWASKLDDAQIINGMFVKASDVVLTENEVKSIRLDYYDANFGGSGDIWLSDAWDAAVEAGDVKDNGCILCHPDEGYPMVAFCWSDEGVEFGNGRDQIVFPEPGIYFAIGDSYVESLVSEVPIKYIKEIIHTVPSECLPVGVGSTFSVSCFMNGEYVDTDASATGRRKLGTCTATYQQVYDAILDGRLASVGINMSDTKSWCSAIGATREWPVMKSDNTEHSAIVFTVSTMDGVFSLYLFGDDSVEMDVPES